MENGALNTLAPSAWERLLAALRPEIDVGAFDTWFRPTRQQHLEGSTLHVTVPNEMFAEWLRTQYIGQIRGAAVRAGLAVTDVRFVLPRPAEPVPVTVVPTEPGREPGKDQAPVPRLNQRYNFDNFVVSSCNQFAHAAALAVGDQPGRTYNPLYIHGGVGLGKTHLMQAIGNRVLANRPTARLRYLTSEEFTNELISAIRFEKTPQFRDRYRSVDVLLIDDIQFLAGKESTQEEFFHTFNALHNAAKQIVITSDCPPRAIPHLEERLRSRFEWGLLADIQPPDLETKVAILKKMAAVRAWHLPDDIAFFIAGNIHTNVRELEGCLTTLMASSSIRRQAPDLALAREVVRSLVPAERDTVTLDAVLRAVARHYELKLADLRSRTNAQRIAFPRQVAMYLGKKLARESLPSIGLALGGKHHTTVLHAVRKIEDLRAKDPALNKTLTMLEEQLQ